MKQCSARWVAGLLLTTVGLCVGPGDALASFVELQGRSRGSSTWIAGNLQNWRELDYIPCRVYITGGPISSQTITIYFPHLNGTTPGFEDLRNFTPSSNAEILSGPTLATPPSGIWSYTFTVRVTDSSPAFVRFEARLAAGAHLNTGSSLMLSGEPSSMGNLQIHKPKAGSGAPDLAITKSGPATAEAGSIITYTLSYTNKATGHAADGAQICDILPPWVTVDPNSLSGGMLVGNTIFWDLGDVAANFSGQRTFTVRIDPAAPEGVLLTNFAQILSSEDDASYADNFSKVVTRVTAPCLVITDQPDSAAVCPGSPVTFSVAAMGTGPIGYQWRRNGNPIAGATEPTYSLDAATALDIGAYDVVVTNACGAVTSAKANLTLLDPVDATPLTNLLRSIGANAVFSTQPLGSGPFTFAWAKDGTVLEGQTQSSLVLTNLAVSDSGTYSVTVMGPCGSVTRSAVLTVDECFPAVDVMLVLDRSKSMDGKPYRDARFAASNFVQNLHYHLKDQAGLVSYNSSATLDQKLTNSLARLEQAIAGIPSADGFTSISLGIKTAQQELMSSRHNPDALPIIVLLSDGMPTASDTKEKALAEALQAKNAGTRIFTVGLGNVDHELMRGMASSPADYFYTTNSSELTDLFNAVSTIICRPPTNIVLAGLSNLTLCPGETALFSVTATGCAPFTYQWMKDGQILPGETNSSLVIPNVSEADEAVYSVDVTGECRTETASAVLTVNEFVAVLVPPANQTHCPGDTAVFSVSATGTDLQYQWYRGDEILAGATNSTLTIPDVSAADAGVYRVVIAGTCGSAATNAAELIVNTPVSIVAPLVDQVVCSGSTVVFSTVASGTGPFSYMWFKDGNVLSETGSALTLNNVTAGDAGIYTVVVSGACGSVTNSASLTVNTVVSATPLLGLTNCPGSTAVFSTVASGSGPFSYAWFKEGNALSETGNTLTLNNVT
ncbi:MAG TPA: VWA domain-containing protein, partial [Verrucomicrobia bacterium]|nr:VWA domain-containing protein [Verrucomicrobiota bacterium]